MPSLHHISNAKRKNPKHSIQKHCVSHHNWLWSTTNYPDSHSSFSVASSRCFIPSVNAIIAIKYMVLWVPPNWFMNQSSSTGLWQTLPWRHSITNRCQDSRKCQRSQRCWIYGCPRITYTPHVKWLVVSWTAIAENLTNLSMFVPNATELGTDIAWSHLSINPHGNKCLSQLWRSLTNGCFLWVSAWIHWYMLTLCLTNRMKDRKKQAIRFSWLPEGALPDCQKMWYIAAITGICWSMAL